MDQTDTQFKGILDMEDFGMGKPFRISATLTLEELFTDAMFTG